MTRGWMLLAIVAMLATVIALGAALVYWSDED